MNFVWNETKNRANLRKHGFHFAEAKEMFRGDLLVRPDVREDYGEKRWIRVISLRKANHEERKEYEKAVQNGLEAH